MLKSETNALFHTLTSGVDVKIVFAAVPISPAFIKQLT